MKHAVITGGSRRLGLFVTKHFLSLGWQVTVLSREKSAELAALSCDNLAIIEVDYCDEENVTEATRALQDQTIDLLLHNASLFDKDANQQADSMAFFDQLYQVHMRFPALLNQLCIDALKRSENANIIHMTDIYAATPQPEYALYSATKAGLESLTKSFAMNFAPDIRVNSIAPGPLMFLPSHSEADKKKVLANTLIPIEAGFAPIVSTIEYIINNQFVTGASHKVDGGRSIKMNT
ncbi:SDR family NAD(P)-dependent oxidoreductase [Reinekea sp.]|jgi:dihydromonapterin reductase/dihydrofolate reductase|uniref:SDR family NAD(P)-dependent oxidoreductase n=1 Tax=Reinekea sp. TaxID=1970455 RepID=UPI00398A49A5